MGSDDSGSHVHMRPNPLIICDNDFGPRTQEEVEAWTPVP